MSAAQHYLSIALLSISTAQHQLRLASALRSITFAQHHLHVASPLRSICIARLCNSQYAQQTLNKIEKIFQRDLCWMRDHISEVQNTFVFFKSQVRQLCQFSPKRPKDFKRKMYYESLMLSLLPYKGLIIFFFNLILHISQIFFRSEQPP